jgi:CRP/FNR family transcriptional regulator, cyclic AMP receptor protein
MDLDLLARVPLFEGLTQAQLKKVAEVCETEEVRRGAYVFREGEPGASMYVVVQGKVRISRQMPGMGEEALTILDAGSAFGEMAVVEEGVRSADAIAHESASLLRIGRDRLEQLLFTDKELAYSVLWALVRTLSGRLRETNERMKALFVMSKF